MNLLLDTHTLIWWFTGSKSISSRAAEAIRNPENEVFVSAISFMEISIKSNLGKMPLMDLDKLSEYMETDSMLHLPVHSRHAQMVGSLPAIHQDPFDRTLVAQSMVENLQLVTRDQILERYDIRIIKA